MGKTRYFTSYDEATDGVFEKIVLPRNHVTMYSYPLKERMIEGTQNLDPGILPVQQEDYSTASFYRVKVTGGENSMRTKGGATRLDSSGRMK